MEHTGGMFKTLGQQARVQAQHPIPDAAFCPECRFLRYDYEGIGAIIDARRMPRALVGCRCAEKETAKEQAAKQRLWDSNLPHPDPARYATFATFKELNGTADALDAAWDFAQGTMAANILVFLGPKGTGKTHLLEAIAREALRRGGDVKHDLRGQPYVSDFTVRYEVASKLLDRMRAALTGQTNEGIHELMEWYESRWLLILDDVEHIKATDMAGERIPALVDDRDRNGTRLVVASNVLTQAEMADKFGDRLADRLWNTRTGAVRVEHLTCESYRTGVV